MEEGIILKKLMENNHKNSVSFHVPGHKYGKIYEKYPLKNVGENMWSLDTTEIPGMDNLHHPQEMIKDAQERAAKLYGADHTFFLINGTSTGIVSMLMAVGNPRDKIIVPRDCHKSVIHGMILGDLEPVYIQPRIHDQYQMSMGIEAEDVERAILENPETIAVLITYPNYYGICSDISAIAEVVHKYDKILMVDGAHGAHLSLSDELPPCPLKANADMVVQSTHKTLPALTQSSMLHVRSDRVDVDRLKFMLQMNQSSSPSYLLMASLDMAMAMVEKEGTRLMEELLKNIHEFHRKISSMDGIRVFNEKMVGSYGVAHMDLTKIVIDMTDLGIDGVSLEEILRTRYNIVMEMATLNTVVGIATMANDKEDFERLLGALEEIMENRDILPKNTRNKAHYYPVPRMKISPRTAAYGRKIEHPFKDSPGRISGEYIIPYPPGIPILCPGEEITTQIIEYVQELMNYRINVIGMKDDTLGKILVIDEK